jgi:hypothetical protein
MTPDQPSIEADNTSIKPRSTPDHRSAITSAPAARLDGRSAVGRRVRDLFRGLMTRMDNPTDVIVVADILAWAELKAAAEVARARLLEDGGSSNECVRIENLVRRAAASVGLEPSTGSSEPDADSLYGGLFIEDDNEGSAS